MPKPNENLVKLHNNLTQKWQGFAVPFEEFEKDMQDESKLTRLHENLSKNWEGFNVPLDKFRTDMGYGVDPVGVDPVGVDDTDDKERNFFRATGQGFVRKGRSIQYGLGDLVHNLSDEKVKEDIFRFAKAGLIPLDSDNPADYDNVIQKAQEELSKLNALARAEIAKNDVAWPQRLGNPMAQMPFDQRYAQSQKTQYDDQIKNLITLTKAAQEARGILVKEGQFSVKKQASDAYYSDQNEWGERTMGKASKVINDMPEPAGFWGKAGSMIPDIAGSAVGAVVSIYNPGVGSAIIQANMATMGLQSYGGTLQQIDQYAKETGVEVDPETRLQVAIAGAAIEAMTEYARIPGITSPMKKYTGTMAKRLFIKKAIANPDIATDAISGFIGKNTTMRKQILAATWDIMKLSNRQGMEEATEEAISSLGQDLLSYAYKNPEDAPGFKEVLSNMGESAMMAYATGPVFGGINKFGKHVNIQRNRQKNGFVTLITDDKGNTFEGLYEKENGDYVVADINGKESTLTSDRVDEVSKFGTKDFERLTQMSRSGKKVTQEVIEQAELNQEYQNIDKDVVSRIYWGEEQFPLMVEGVEQKDPYVVITAKTQDGTQYQIVSGSVNSPDAANPMVGINIETGEKRMLSDRDVSNIDIVPAAKMRADLRMEASNRVKSKYQLQNIAADIQDNYEPGDQVTFNGQQAEIVDVSDPSQGVTIKITDAKGGEQSVTIAPDQLNLLQPVGEVEASTGEVSPTKAWTVGKKQFSYTEKEDGVLFVSFKDGKDETKTITAEVDDTQYDIVPVTEEVPIPNAPPFAKKKTETVVKGVNLVPKAQINEGQPATDQGTTVTPEVNHPEQQATVQAPSQGEEGAARPVQQNTDGVSDVTAEAATPVLETSPEVNQPANEQDIQGQPENEGVQQDQPQEAQAVIPEKVQDTPASPNPASPDVNDQVAGVNGEYEPLTMRGKEWIFTGNVNEKNGDLEFATEDGQSMWVAKGMGKVKENPSNQKSEIDSALDEFLNAHKKETGEDVRLRVQEDIDNAMDQFSKARTNKERKAAIETVAKIFSDNGLAIPISVHEDAESAIAAYEKLPTTSPLNAQRVADGFRNNNANAFYDQKSGTIFICASNTTSFKVAVETIVHESCHNGTQKSGKQSLISLFDKVGLKIISKFVPKWYISRFSGDASGKAELSDELVSYITEKLSADKEFLSAFITGQDLSLFVGDYLSQFKDIPSDVISEISNTINKTLTNIDNNGSRKQNPNGKFPLFRSSDTGRQNGGGSNNNVNGEISATPSNRGSVKNGKEVEQGDGGSQSQRDVRFSVEEDQAETLSSGIKLVNAYIKSGVYKFSDIVNNLVSRGIKISDGLLMSLKKAYASIIVSQDIDGLDDISTVKNYKVEIPPSNNKQPEPKDKEPKDEAKRPKQLSVNFEQSNESDTRPELVKPPKFAGQKMEQILAQGKVKKVKAKRPKQHSKEQQQVKMMDFFSPSDLALQYFASGGKLHTSSLFELFGTKGKEDDPKERAKIESERRPRFTWVSKQGETINQIAHRLWEDNAYLRFDTEDYREAIEDAILGFNSPQAMAKELLIRHSQEQQEAPEGWISEEEQAEIRSKEFNDIFDLLVENFEDYPSQHEIDLLFLPYEIEQDGTEPTDQRVPGKSNPAEDEVNGIEPVISNENPKEGIEGSDTEQNTRKEQIAAHQELEGIGQVKAEIPEVEQQPAPKFAGEKLDQILKQDKKDDNPPADAPQIDNPTPPKPPKPKDYGKSNKVFTEDAAAKARAALKNKFGNLNTGIDPETMMNGITLAGFHIEAGARKFADYARAMIEDAGNGIKPYLKSFYEGIRNWPGFNSEGLDSQDFVRTFDIENFNTQDDVLDRPGSGEPDSPISPDEVPEDESPVPNDGGEGGQVGNGTKKGSNKTGGRGSGKSGSGLFTSLFGEPSDNEVYQQDEEPGIENNDAGDFDGRGSRNDGAWGYTNDNTGAEEEGNPEDQRVSESFKERTRQRIIQQKKVENVPVQLMDEANIRETLPVLLPEQQDDVLKAERRFFGEQHKTKELANGKGMLFTNGTGTGKTFTGLGIIKRFAKQGKTNILIVVPSEAKVNDWIKDAEALGLKVTVLKNTKDQGKGINITTYATFRANENLKNRDLDLVVYDESHRIMEEKKGTASATTFAHYQMANTSVRSALDRITSVHTVWVEVNNLRDAIRRESKLMNNLDMMDWDYAQRREQVDKWEARVKELTTEQAKLLPGLTERAEKAFENTKVVFLSATPFKGHFNLRYAKGSLINWDEETVVNARGSRVDGESRFFLENFGSAYEWKYHRLQVKEAANAEAIAMQEVEFAEKLMRQGVMSGRAIESDKDYSREFPLVALENSEVINRAYNDIYNRESDEFSMLRGATGEVFSDYQYKTRLFESLKASMLLPRIEKHLALGRKVVVFHRRKQANVEPPFALILRTTKINATGVLMSENATEKEKAEAALALQQVDAFEDKYSDLLAYEQTLNYSSAIDQIVEKFGADRVTQINGDISKKDKPANIEKFNDDNSGVDIIIVQEEAGKEGISLHDTSGKHQRVLMSLSLPISSTTALQIEGRIFRIGQETDAIFENPLLGLDMEVAAFGQTVNKKLSTTENLAIGNQARDLLRSFAEGVLFNSSQDDPNTNQGRGGKEYDKKEQETLSEFRKAVLVYNTNQKTTGRRDQREGVDYFATPEPVGQKMVEWLDINEGESVLEPSAGHGAIAMWFPEKSAATVVEPSYSLFSKLSARAGGGTRKLINDIFENLNLVNKFHGIAMNPPFGSGGKTAMDHVEKAFNHLKNGGRVVALIPNGGSMDKRLEQFLYGTDENGKQLNPDAQLVASIKLPSVTFKQAGTSVSSRIVVIDRVESKTFTQFLNEVGKEQNANYMRGRTVLNADAIRVEAQIRYNAQQSKIPDPDNIDLSYIDKIDDLFDAIEDIDLPKKRLHSGTEVTPQAIPAAAKDDGVRLDVKYQLATVKHTKTGEDLFIVKLPNRVSENEYKEINAKAKAAGGFWDKFSKGFRFGSIEDRQKFVDNAFAFKDDNEVRFRTVSPSGFYSTVESSLESIKQEKGSVAQFKAMLLKNGAKQAEMDWMGFDEFSQDKKSLTKADIQNWIDQNKIEVEEVQKSDKGGVVSDLDMLTDNQRDELDQRITNYPEYEKINDLIDGANVYVDKGGIVLLDESYIENQERYEENYDEVVVLLEDINYKLQNEIIGDVNTKYSQYQLPGGKNYKEVLLTMPGKSKPPKLNVTKESWEYGNINGEIKKIPGDIYQVYRKGKEFFKAKSLSEVKNGLKERISDYYGLSSEAKGEFKSAHFNEPNILAHIRFNERTDSEGNKVLFIEEIQSDWAQTGKKEGFKGDATYEPILEKENVWDVGGVKVLYFERGIDGKNYRTINKKREQVWFNNFSDAVKEANNTVKNISEKEIFKVPNMPFKKTDQWVNLAARRMMRYAAENGFDRIAWTNGEQQADRYDLSKQVDDIWTSEFSNSWNGKQYEKLKDVEITLKGGEVKKLIINESGKVVRGDFEGESLDNVVGKEMAEKIIGAQEDTNFGEQDFKVGGEGMKAFYDAIVPSAMSKLGKPFGAKVENVNIQVKDGEPKGRYIHPTITDAGYAMVRDTHNGNEEIYSPSNIPAERDQWLSDKMNNKEDRMDILTTVQSLPVTESMRKSAIEGLPLFRQQDTESDTPLTPFIKRADELKQRSARAKELGKRFGVPVKVITNRNQLPERILRRMAAGKLYPGVFDGRTGQIYVLVDEVTDMSEVEKTIAHEVVAHKGLREMLGKDEFDSMLSDVFADMDAIDINFIRDQYKTKTHDPSNAEIAEEYIASLAETGNFPLWFGRVITKVRSLLRSAGFKVEFTDADIMYLLWESQRRLLKNAGAAGYVQYKDKEGDVVENVRFSSKPLPLGEKTEGMENDYELSEDNSWKFQYDLMKSIRPGYSARLDYTRIGNTILRVKGHTPNWSNFSEDLYNDETIDRVINVTVGNYNNSDSRQNKTRIDQIEDEFPNVEFIDIEIEDGEGLADNIQQLSRYFNKKQEPQIKPATGKEPKRIYKNGKAKTYKTKEGETIPFDQANDYDNGAKGADLQRKDNRQQNPSLRKLREGEIATVENKYTADKNFIFDGRNKIESTDDVAFLFRKLETKAVENMFAALVDENGKAVIVHISMGGRAGTVMDFGILADAINRFTPKKVYLIHNHPSGNLTYSDADIRVHGKAKMAFGEDLIGEHIIINTTSGEYASFNNKYDYSVQERPKVVNELQKYKVIKLDKQLFLTDTKLPVIKGASDVASFLTAQRFSQGGKLSAIILARNNEIKAYLHLPSTNFSKLAEVEKLVTELQAYAGRFGGFGIILASNTEITKNYRLLGDSLRSSDLELLDIVSVAGNNNYDSMADMGLIVSEPDIRFKISPTNKPTLDPVMVEGKREKFRENVQDKMLAPKNMQDEVAKRGGAVPQSADGYNAENRSQSRSMAMITNFNNNELDQLNTTLAEIVFKHDQDLKAISNYMLAKSSIERNNEEGTKALNDDVNGEWGQVEVEQIIADFEAAVPPAVVDQLWKDIKATTDFAIKTLYMGNVIGKDAYNAMKARKYYVPLKSWDFTDTENPVDFYSYAQGERTAYQGLHKAKGRGSKAADPLAYIESAAHSAVVSANKNMVKHKFLMLARLNPNMKDLFNIKKIYLMEKGVDAEGNPVYVNVIKDGEDAFSINGVQNNGQPILVNEGTFEDLYEAGTIVSKVSRRHMTRRPSYLASQHEVEVMENGERYIIAYGDPNVANSINGMNVAMPETTRWMQQTMYGKFMRWVTAGFTAKNPAFIPINWIRDLGYSSMSHALRKDGDLKGFVKNYKPGVAAIHRHLAGTAKPDQKADKDSKAYRDYLYEQFRLFGGETGFVHLKEIKDLQKDIDREVNRKGGKREGWDKVSQNRAYSALGSLLDYSAILSENSARFATFLASYEGGKSFEQSASDAKNISVNFNRKGRITGLAGTFYGFFNATVQGADNYFEMSIKNKKNMAIAATSFFVAGVMLSEILKAAGPDDEEGKNAYDQLPEWVRKSNLCIPNFNGGFFTIPLPFVFREIYGAGVTLSDIAHGTKEPGEGIFDTFTSMFSAFSPIAVNSDELREGKPPLRTLIPTLLTPIYDNIVNQDFTGRQVYRVPFTKEMERYTPNSELGAYNVNSLLETIAKGLNKLGGGNEYTPAGMQPKDGNVEPSLVTRFLADWNPSKAEHLLEYYLGGRGRFVNDIYKTVNAAVSSEKEVRTYNIPILKRLYTTPYKGDYWNEYREIQQEVKDFNRYLKLAEDNKDFQTMQEMLSNRRMRIISDMYKDRDKQVKELSDLIEVLQDPDQKKSARDMRELTIKTFVEQTHIIEDITKPTD